MEGLVECWLRFESWVLRCSFVRLQRLKAVLTVSKPISVFEPLLAVFCQKTLKLKPSSSSGCSALPRKSFPLDSKVEFPWKPFYDPTALCPRNTQGEIISVLCTQENEGFSSSFPFCAPRHAEKNYFKHNLWLGLREKSINRVFCMQAMFGRSEKKNDYWIPLMISLFFSERCLEHGWEFIARWRLRLE